MTYIYDCIVDWHWKVAVGDSFWARVARDIFGVKDECYITSVDSGFYVLCYERDGATMYHAVEGHIEHYRGIEVSELYKALRQEREFGYHVDLNKFQLYDRVMAAIGNIASKLFLDVKSVPEYVDINPVAKYDCVEVGDMYKIYFTIVEEELQSVTVYNLCRHAYAIYDANKDATYCLSLFLLLTKIARMQEPETDAVQTILKFYSDEAAKDYESLKQQHPNISIEEMIKLIRQKKEGIC